MATEVGEAVVRSTEGSGRVALAIACAFFALVLASCNLALESQYYKEGIGSDLPTPDIVSTTDLLDVYLNELCREAGGRQVASDINSQPVLSCPNWRIVTLAGLNDIDRRCDAYLAWLDDKRRSREPILAEIGAIAGATAAILGATGVGVIPITVVGIAFGLASNTFTNIRSRLLLEADNTTVQSIVMSRQKDFRAIFPARIDSQTEAIYVMRSYLRICMPMTIEMNINATVAIFENAGPGALARAEPLTDPQTSRPGGASSGGAPPQIKSTQQLRPTPPGLTTLLTPLTDVEKTVSLADAAAFQRTLCVPSASGDFGLTGSSTRTQLQDFLRARYYPKANPNSQPDRINTDSELRWLRSAQTIFPKCEALGFANGFEVGIFSRPVSANQTKFDPMETISDVVAVMSKAEIAITVPAALQVTEFDASVVKALHGVIPALRMKLGLSGTGKALDVTLYDKIERSQMR